MRGESASGRPRGSTQVRPALAWRLVSHTQNLNSVLDREREMSDQATDLAEVGIPFHYNAIAHLLLKQYASTPAQALSLPLQD